jgi:hypothetical protein
MTSLLVVVECDGGSVLLDAEITFLSQADLTTLSQKLASDVKMYARSGKKVEFGYAFANGARYAASVEKVDTAIRVDELADFVTNCV